MWLQLTDGSSGCKRYLESRMQSDKEIFSNSRSDPGNITGIYIYMMCAIRKYIFTNLSYSYFPYFPCICQQFSPHTFSNTYVGKKTHSQSSEKFYRKRYKRRLFFPLKKKSKAHPTCNNIHYRKDEGLLPTCWRRTSTQWLPTMMAHHDGVCTQWLPTCNPQCCWSAKEEDVSLMVAQV